MGKDKDPAWAHCSLLKRFKHATICKFCCKMICGGGIARFKQHLAGINGRRVSPCVRVPESVRDETVRQLSSEPSPAMNHQSMKIKKKGKSSSIIIGRPCTRASKSVRSEMVCQLSNDKDLDANVFDPLLEDLWSKIPEQKRKNCMYLYSLWFSLYKDESKRNDVLKWIKKTEILSKNYVFIPICFWTHWNLLILCNFGNMNKKPCMILLDSLLDNDPKRLENDIRSLIFDIYDIKERGKGKEFIQNIPLLVPKVPQQKKGNECGFFVLYYICRFIGSTPVNFTLRDYPSFLSIDWFSREEFENFYMEIESYLTNEMEIENLEDPKLKKAKSAKMKKIVIPNTRCTRSKTKTLKNNA